MKLLGWLKGKLTGDAAKAVTQLEAKPTDEDSARMFRIQLKKALETDAALTAELSTLLDKTPKPIAQIAQTLIQKGRGQKTAQVAGDQNTTIIR